MGMIIVGAIGTLGGTLITLIMTIPGMIMWFLGFRWYDKAMLIEKSEIISDHSPELSLIRILRVASNLDIIISRLFKVVMLVAAIFGISTIILLLIYLDGKESLNSEERRFFTFSIPTLGIFYVLLLMFVLNLRTNGQKLSYFLQPLDYSPVLLESVQITCPKCNDLVLEDIKYCNTCGFELELFRNN